MLASTDGESLLVDGSLKLAPHAAVVIDRDTTAPGAVVGKIKTHTSYGFATQVCILDGEGRLEASELQS